MLPDTELLRQRHIVRHYGLTKWALEQLVDAGVLRPVGPLKRAGVGRWFRRKDVVKVLEGT